MEYVIDCLILIACQLSEDYFMSRGEGIVFIFMFLCSCFLVFFFAHGLIEYE